MLLGLSFAVGAVLAAALRGPPLGGVLGDQFVEGRLFAFGAAEDAAETLDVFAGRTGAGDDDADRGFRGPESGLNQSGLNQSGLNQSRPESA